MKTKQSTFQLVLTAIFIAIIILQSFVPLLGNIPLVVLDITIIHVTVIVGAIVLGEKTGLLLGIVWGICSMLRAYMGTNAISFLVFSNPVIAIVPRALVGYLSGVVYRLLQKTPKVAMSVAGVVGSLTNTVGVLSLIYFLVGSTYAEKIGQTMSALPALLMGIVGTNGVPEAIASAILTPIIASVLLTIAKKRKG